MDIEKKPETLAITWAPRPLNLEPISQLEALLTDLRELKSCCSGFEMYPELTVNGGLHFHGLLQLKDKIKWHKRVLPILKRKGYVLIKNKNLNEGWQNYIKKDAEIMKEILEMEIPLTEQHERLKNVIKNQTQIGKPIKIVPVEGRIEELMLRFNE